jgi:hypothetical protein
VTTEREDLLDLLPLLASGALEPEERARAEELLGRHEDLASEAGSYRELDALLRRALRRSAAAPSVRRQCPFCKDDLRKEAEVLCASCLTPHHKACFSENRGCSLLGCHGTRSVSAEEPSLEVCPSCGEHTPTGAPFCAWCRVSLGGDRLPRHATPGFAAPPASHWAERLRFVAASAAILLMGLSIGWFFEVRQNTIMDALIAQARERALRECSAELQRALDEVVKAQAAYKRAHEVVNCGVTSTTTVTINSNIDNNAVLPPDYGKAVITPAPEQNLVIPGVYAARLDELADITSRSDFCPRGVRILMARSVLHPEDAFAAIAVPERPMAVVPGYPLVTADGDWPYVYADQTGVHVGIASTPLGSFVRHVEWGRKRIDLDELNGTVVLPHVTGYGEEMFGQ